MEFKLQRDIVFFDIEATGLSIIKDRIVQLAMIKYSKKGGEPIEKCWMINPGVPISEEAMAVHGITPKDVARKPSFRDLAEEIYDFIGHSDLGGYNSNRFDVPMLMEEFARVGMELDISKRNLIDAQRIFYKMEPRTLGAAYKFYCGKKMENAHDALVDVRATVEVLKGQLDKYEGVDWENDDEVIKEPVQNDMKALHDFVNDMRWVEPTQKLKMDKDGTIIFNFGKYHGKPVGASLAADKPYYKWILNMEFTNQVKQMVKELVKSYESKDRFIKPASCSLSV